MEYIFRNVNIDSINFINNKNDVKFEFIDSYANSGKYYGELVCTNVLSLNMNTDLYDDPYFPQFICDVSVENSNVTKTVKFQGGAYEITIICEGVAVIRV